MRKVKSFKNFVIAEPSKKDKKEMPNISNYLIFTKDEWAYGEGCRYEEFNCDTITEAMDFIKSY